ncbi:MAG TPA: hypothetical protein IGS53_10465 [Leptolyngbyaceae cyanobacterium M33_DOE_097]|uniref:Uncharacterized protein n=1 Tax=Oscillatoriales cyanobacterium SpSt-418 TaxID=2282169 RepID=A0A7C3PG73_9CYAN|nr:hypothetical protein [Leptolyngbyaceae cyanobacterium M33_DOE_097]
MDYDEYWHSLVLRVCDEQEKLYGDEDRFYRLSCIYGETIVDGIEAYFERRFDEIEKDMAALRNSGFNELASEFDLARELLFGSAPLNRKNLEVVIQKLMDATEDVEAIQIEIGKIYDRVIPQLDRLADYKYSFGLAAGFFRDD